MRGQWIRAVELRPVEPRNPHPRRHCADGRCRSLGRRTSPMQPLVVARARLLWPSILGLELRVRHYRLARRKVSSARRAHLARVTRNEPPEVSAGGTTSIQSLRPSPRRQSAGSCPCCDRASRRPPAARRPHPPATEKPRRCSTVLQRSPGRIARRSVRTG